MVIHTFKNGTTCHYHGWLIPQLDSLVLNVGKDWDFVIVISGNRMVRVGKSVLALQIGAYLADRLGTSFDISNIYFDGETMVKEAQTRQKNSVLVYDEAREGLAANKSLLKTSKDLVDFFNECGQLNHIFIIVLPDYFKLTEEIAVGRSEYLINVYRKEERQERDLYNEGTKRPVVKLTRGFYQFFNRYQKASLFDKSISSRRRSYMLIKPSFEGNFTNTYTISEEEYRAKKSESLKRFNERKEGKDFKVVQRKPDIIRNKIIMELHEKGLVGREIAEELFKKYEFIIDPIYINRIIKHYTDLNAKNET